jgi:hypothetical protein
MKMLAKVVVLSLSASALLGGLGCSRNNIEAVNLANEGDKAKSRQRRRGHLEVRAGRQLDPTNHRILWKLALAYTEEGRVGEGRVDLPEGRKLAPTFANYFFQHGLALARMAVRAPGELGRREGAPRGGDPEGREHRRRALRARRGALTSTTSSRRSARTRRPSRRSPTTSRSTSRSPTSTSGSATSTRPSRSSRRASRSRRTATSSCSGCTASRAASRSRRATRPARSREYEAAKKACGPCNEAGQQIAFFNLGAAYAQLSPPKKSEAMQQIGSFQKMVCKGAAAKRYEDQCAYAQQIATKLGAPLQ